jgi:hypothetical protein
MTARPLALLLTAALMAPLCLLPASAQTSGGPVPPYEPPAPVAPSRTATDTATDGFERTPREDPFKSQEELVQQFSGAYQKGGKPRLAFYWNRQLTDTLNQWYSDTRVVTSNKAENSTTGDITLQQSGSAQTVAEIQRRNPDERRRVQPTENWEWEFQDGFLAPFLAAGATVLDRTAILRITGAGAKNVDDLTVETMALQGMADLLVEVLVTPSGHSTTGYELRARILDVKTGRIMAYVSSRGLKEWERHEKYLATSRGFESLDDEDEDGFGPESADRRYKATSHGISRVRKPPKLRVISQNLAYNVMKGMINQWH